MVFRCCLIPNILQNMLCSAEERKSNSFALEKHEGGGKWWQDFDFWVEYSFQNKWQLVLYNTLMITQFRWGLTIHIVLDTIYHDYFTPFT